MSSSGELCVASLDQRKVYFLKEEGVLLVNIVAVCALIRRSVDKESRGMAARSRRCTLLHSAA